MTVIRGRLSTRDLQTALSCFFFCTPLQNFSNHCFEARVKPQAELPGGFLSGVCIALFSRCSVRTVRTGQTDASLSGCSGAQRLLSLVLTAVHARHGDAARSRRIGSPTLGFARWRADAC